ncbi:MAG TPA: FkbM family methyltransferase [Burkholderiales bacterium]|jgi:FkbM family methyltransferase
MLNRLLQRLSAKPGGATAPLPEMINLAAQPLLRLIDPGYSDGFSALVKSSQGLFIINRYDTGVGMQLGNYNAYAPEEVAIIQQLVRAAPADPVVLDIGANIGVVTLAMARAAGRGGLVHAFEAQRVVFHMLAGNMALNGVENVHCHHMAVGAQAGNARVARLDYRAQGSFGSLELNRETQSDLGQQAQDGAFEEVRMDSIDSLQLPRVDVIKIDVEGMEPEVLAGAARTLRAHRPLLYVEHLKTGREPLWRLLRDLGYLAFEMQDNFIGLPQGDPRTAAITGDAAPWSPPA